MIEKNQIYTVKIDNMTPQGYGVGRLDEKVIFIKNALPQEVVETKVVLIKKKYLGGIIEKIIEPSPNRIEARCGIFGKCGGCTIQNLDYESQLKYKKQNIRECLERLGGISNPDIEEIIGMDNPWEYRNKTQYPVQQSKEGIKIGFYKEKSHIVIDAPECPIQMNTAEKVRDIFYKYLTDNKISIYNEKVHKGIVRNIVIRTSSKTGKIMICIVINERTLPLHDLFVFTVINAIPEVSSIFINRNRSKTNVILGEAYKLVYGEKKLLDTIGGKDYLLSPGSFFQVNPRQTEVLYNKVLELSEPTGDETVLDIFSGIGTIGIYMAEKVKKVIGIESYEKAVEDAEENAKLNNVNNITFIHGKAEESIYELKEENIKPDIVILDPPRRGCESILIDAIKEMEPKKIIYVSCDPATLSRDLKLFIEGGKYKLDKVQPLDMFPQTGHVECVIRLRRQNSL